MRLKPLELPGALEAIEQRRSFRAYLDRPVPQTLLERLLKTARWSPSSTNMQPWQVFVVSGEKKRQLDQRLLAAYEQKLPMQPKVNAYMDEWTEPFKGRRHACGIALYQALGIGREDQEKRTEQTRRNFIAFGAPTAIFLAMPDVLKEGSLFDCGMFCQSMMLAAVSLGLETCPEASLVFWPGILQEFFQVGPETHFLTGLAVGYGDYQAPVNQYKTERAELSEWATFFE